MEQNNIQVMTEKIKSDAMAAFESGLAKLQLELSQNLYNIDTLKKDQVEKTLTLFNKRLVIFQYDFIQYLKNTYCEANGADPRQFDFRTPSKDVMDKIYTSLIATGTGGSAILLLTLITVPTKTWWIFTTMQTLGALIGGLIGVSTAWVTYGAGLLVGVVVAVAVNRATRNSRRRKNREKLIEYYTKEVEPQLKDWAKTTIENISKS